MNIAFHEKAWEEYLFWQKNDKGILKRIHTLIEDVKRHPFEGIGKPEKLKNELSGFWSRRITHEHRMVYTVQNDIVIISQCRFHY